MFILLLTSMLTLAFNIQAVNAQGGTIYIRADGSIDPPTAPISTFDNVTYTLTGDIFNDSIWIERDNIVVDGAGYMVENGIRLSDRINVTIKNMTTQSISLNHYSNYNTISGNNITSNWGLGYLSVTNSRNNTICGNNITNSGGGIQLYNSEGNSISGNNIIANSAWGISFSYYSSNNTIYGNNIKNNFNGIGFDSSSNNNTIYYNNFINNTYHQVSSEEGSTNIWDNGREGNYWSDYNGTDANHDGIGDTPYIIDANNTDHYPLMVQYVIPEFPTFLVLPLFMIATLLAIVVYKRRILSRAL